MKTRPLNEIEIQSISYQSDWVHSILQSFFNSDIRLSKTEDDIPSLQTLIEDGPYSEQAETEMLAFGFIFGEVLATELDMSWVIVEDESGTDFALQYQDREIYLFPKEMLIKRIEQGEELNLNALYHNLKELVCKQIQDLEIA